MSGGSISTNFFVRNKLYIQETTQYKRIYCKCIFTIKCILDPEA
jgi:hypothetical protein